MSVRLQSVLIAAALVACSPCVKSAPDVGACRLLPIEIVAGPDAGQFTGRFGAFESVFRGDRADPGVDLFPEPPLTLRSVASGASCDIDGGVWVRRAMWGDDRHAMLLVQEFSGSDDRLVFHDARTCARVAELDVAGARWRVEPSAVEIGRHCRGTTPETCAQRRRVTLDANCRAVEAVDRTTSEKAAAKPSNFP
jgi:hypothetical protein